MGPQNIESPCVPMYHCSVWFRIIGIETGNRKRESGHSYMSVKGPIIPRFTASLRWFAMNFVKEGRKGGKKK